MDENQATDRAPVIATLIEDRKVPGQFRVEAEVDDGGMEVAVFSGPNAKDRAIIFAGGEYYDGWMDPEDHGGALAPREQNNG